MYQSFLDRVKNLSNEQIGLTNENSFNIFESGTKILTEKEVKRSDNGAQQFATCFHQSEQVFLTYALLEQGSVLSQAIRELKNLLRKDQVKPFSIMIDGVDIDLASHRHICKFCRASIQNAFSSLKNKLIQELGNTNDVDEFFDTSSLSLRIRASGRKHTDMK